MVEVTVTQRDRDAAADYYYSAGGSPEIARQIRDGKKDGWFRVQALARHRASTAPDAEPVAWNVTWANGRKIVLTEPDPADWLTVTPLYTHPAEPVAQAVEALEWCADDLEAEIRSRWIEPDTGLPHPANKHRYDRDMEPVRKARAALAAMGERSNA